MGVSNLLLAQWASNKYIAGPLGQLNLLQLEVANDLLWSMATTNKVS